MALELKIKTEIRRIICLFFIISHFVVISAQVPLTTTTNTLHHGDILCKVEVPYVDVNPIYKCFLCIGRRKRKKINELF